MRDRIGWTLKGRQRGRREQESSPESILLFGYCPTFLFSLFARRTAVSAAVRSEARVACKGAWRPHCGKYYRIFTALLQSWQGSRTQALILLRLLAKTVTVALKLINMSEVITTQDNIHQRLFQNMFRAFRYLLPLPFADKGLLGQRQMITNSQQ